jgi:site-specific recombinase XerD
MLKRRLEQAGLSAHNSPHSFRTTGITNFLENDGTLEAAQRIAGHADSRTTKMTAAARRFCSKIWRGYGTDVIPK